MRIGRAAFEPGIAAAGGGGSGDPGEEEGSVGGFEEFEFGLGSKVGEDDPGWGCFPP